MPNSKSLNAPKKILILGAGFGGLETAKMLGRRWQRWRSAVPYEVVLISSSKFFTFTPFLHKGLRIDDPQKVIGEPISLISRRFGFTFIEATINLVDLNSFKIEDTNGKVYDYDYLVYALGAETNFYSVPGADKYSYTFKNLSDSLSLKSILDNKIVGGEKIIMVGAGATGVKLSAEVADYLQELDKQVDITLIESSDRIGKQHSPRYSKYMHKSLTNRGIKVITKARVEKVESSKVKVSGEYLSSDLTIWTAGITPVNVIRQDLGVDPRNRILVDEYLQPAGYRNVFIFGDAAQIEHEHLAYPQLAQVAIKQAWNVARNIIRSINGTSLKSFKYRSDGTLISLGRKNAVGEVKGIFIRGRFAWAIWNIFYKYREFILRR